MLQYIFFSKNVTANPRNKVNELAKRNVTSLTILSQC